MTSEGPNISAKYILFDKKVYRKSDFDLRYISTKETSNVNIFYHLIIIISKACSNSLYSNNIFFSDIEGSIFMIDGKVI